MSDKWIHGRSTYLKYKCRCDVCCADAKQYKANYIPGGIRLSPEPLIQRLHDDGRGASINTSLVFKWRKKGMDVFVADRWAVRLGYHPYEIWGNDFYRGCEDYV